MKLYTHTHTIFLQKNCWTVWGESKSLVKISFNFDAKKSEEKREENRKNRIDNSKKLIKEAIKKWINKKDGLLYGKLESTKFSSYKSYDSLSFL